MPNSRFWDAGTALLVGKQRRCAMTSKIRRCRFPFRPPSKLISISSRDRLPAFQRTPALHKLIAGTDARRLFVAGRGCNLQMDQGHGRFHGFNCQKSSNGDICQRLRSSHREEAKADRTAGRPCTTAPSRPGLCTPLWASQRHATGSAPNRIYCTACLPNLLTQKLTH